MHELVYLYGRSFWRVLFLHDSGNYVEMVFEKDDLFWCGVVPTLQFSRGLEMFNRVALLDNGDKSSSHE